jgi:hypothetical protein
MAAKSDGDGRTGLEEFPVRVLTRNAGQDKLSETEYREIYDEVRGFDEASGKYGVSLDAFVEMIGSAFSKAAWSKYHRGELELNRTMRNELRAAVGLAVLPPTVTEVTTGVDPDAEVVQVGDETVRRVVLVGTGEKVVVFCNGAAARVVDEVDAAGGGGAGRVTAVTRSRKGVFVPAQVFERVNGLRRLQGLSWVEVLEAAERALAGDKKSLLDVVDGVERAR